LEEVFIIIYASVNNSRKNRCCKNAVWFGDNEYRSGLGKTICKEYNFDLQEIRKAENERLLQIDGIGEVIADTFIAYFSEEKNNMVFERLLKELELEVPKKADVNENIKEKTFVITGSLIAF
jgi:DNA ligase (NAD+)